MINVIGPINKRNWKTLRMLRASIKQMKAANDNDLADQIKTETKLYDNLLYLVCRVSKTDADMERAA